MRVIGSQIKIVRQRVIYSCELSCFGNDTPEATCKLLMDLGSAWKKQTPSGRVFYKMKLDALRSAGKAVYAKAWSRRSDGRVFDSYFESTAASGVLFDPRSVRDVTLPMTEPGMLIDTI